MSKTLGFFLKIFWYLHLQLWTQISRLRVFESFHEEFEDTNGVGENPPCKARMRALGGNFNVDREVADASKSAGHPESVKVKVSGVKADADIRSFNDFRGGSEQIL